MLRIVARARGSGTQVESGRRDWIRTNDPYRVEVVL